MPKPSHNLQKNQLAEYLLLNSLLEKVNVFLRAATADLTNCIYFIITKDYKATLLHHVYMIYINTTEISFPML